MLACACTLRESGLELCQEEDVSAWIAIAASGPGTPFREYWPHSWHDHISFRAACELESPSRFERTGPNGENSSLQASMPNANRSATCRSDTSASGRISFSASQPRPGATVLAALIRVAGRSSAVHQRDCRYRR